MKFSKTQTSYSISIDDDDFLALLDSESYATDYAAYKKHTKSLYDKLEILAGVWDIDYDGHFGSQIILSIDVDEDTDELKETIINIIKEHLTWCKSLELVDWVKKKREKDK